MMIALIEARLDLQFHKIVFICVSEIYIYIFERESRLFDAIDGRIIVYSSLKISLLIELKCVGPFLYRQKDSKIFRVELRKY